MQYKLLRVTDETYEKLTKMGSWKDTADTLISRLIEESNNSKALEQPVYRQTKMDEF